jgi:hypothetical protein
MIDAIRTAVLWLLLPSLASAPAHDTLTFTVDTVTT